MILAVGNTKGGVGKTTLAVNLAVARALAGRDLLLVDGAEQGTALTFTELRADRLGQPGYTAAALTDPGLRPQVRQLAAEYDDILPYAVSRSNYLHLALPPLTVSMCMV